MESMEEGVISSLRRDGEHATADRILAERNYSMGVSHQQCVDKAKVLKAAEEYIKKAYMDWDHCAQSARAVHMFLRGVEWTLEK